MVSAEGRVKDLGYVSCVSVLCERAQHGALTLPCAPSGTTGPGQGAGAWKYNRALCREIGASQAG